MRKAESTGRTASMACTMSRMRRTWAADSTTTTMFCAGTASTPPYAPSMGLICSATSSARALSSGRLTVTIWSGVMASTPLASVTGRGFFIASWMVAR